MGLCRLPAGRFIGLETEAQDHAAGIAGELRVIRTAGGNRGSLRRAVRWVTGNSINTLFFGSGSDAAAGMGANAPGLVSTAMGSAPTFGR